MLERSKVSSEINGPREIFGRLEPFFDRTRVNPFSLNYRDFKLIKPN